MRQKLNENPMLQLAVVAALLVAVGLFVMMGMKSKPKKYTPPANQSAAAGTTAGSGTSNAVATPGVAAAPTTAGAPAAGTSGMPPMGTGTVTPQALVPGPGLPKPVMTAWKGGDAIVLLVRGKGIDDDLVNKSVSELNSEPHVAVFVTRPRGIARYSRITQGAGVNRTPALVVVRPKKISGTTPQAEVSYAFRNADSVVQAVHDALYTGPDDLPYSPG
jgi:hypothetical protein